MAKKTQTTDKGINEAENKVEKLNYDEMSFEEVKAEAKSRDPKISCAGGKDAVIERLEDRDATPIKKVLKEKQETVIKTLDRLDVEECMSYLQAIAGEYDKALGKMIQLKQAEGKPVARFYAIKRNLSRDIKRRLVD